jgi:subtilisin-like proprotein convertase family protein
MMKKHYYLPKIAPLLISFFIFGNGYLFGQGNTPCTAVAVTPTAACSYSISGTTVGATYQNNANNGGTPSCASPGAPDVWYMFTATVSGNYTIDLNSGSITDSGMGLYGGAACNSLSQIACDDDGSANGAMSMITSSLTAGTTYYIRIWQYSSGTGTFSMCVTTPPAAPANDNCAGATTVTQEPNGSCTTITSTVAGATNSGIGSCTGTADDDVWFKFTATSTSAIINRTTTSGWDSGVEIFASTGAAPGSCIGASLGCQDAESAFNVSGLTVGMNYYVRVYSWSASFTPSPATFTFCVTSPPTLPAGAIVMTTGSTSACSGTFYDSGGLGDYSNSETRVFTICPSTAGAKLKLVFSAFQTESIDYLEIFDGNSVAAPSLGTYSGSTGPGTVQATVSNASGCLTFRFTSDGSLVYSGWEATISCIIPCQTITSNWVSSTEAPMADGVIRICQGQSINLVGSGTFGTSGTGATYSWSMGNGVSVSGSNINYTYPAVGSYLANLNIVDPSGCTNTNSINRNIEVSTTPTISTSATPSTLCTSQTSALAATVTMTPYTVNCTPPVSGTTFLPDGSGVSYTTAITTNCYSPTATVTAVTDITNICLNMEHSYSGDLSMSIACPNGQSTSLITYSSGTGSANLGSPWATATVDGSSTTITPGVGATYCFSSTASTAWASAPVTGGTFVSGNGPSTYTDSYIPAGTYLPMQSFASLIGCPLNGSWTITVTDNLGSDNGYIFNWDINFSAALLSASSFTPTIVSQGWVASPILSSTGATTANVIPTSQGTPCFTYSVTDNFGCTYTAPQCITVNCGISLPVSVVDFDATAYDNSLVRLTWETSSEQDNDYFEVERSLTGVDQWESIGTVAGAGNSQESIDYFLDDKNPYLGVSYYRLKQVDFNGQARYFEIKAVRIDASDDQELVIFPNPATDLVTIQGDLVVLSTFKLLNALGQDIRMNVNSYKQGDGSLVIDVSTLKSGVYTVKHGSKVYSLVKY